MKSEILKDYTSAMVDSICRIFSISKTSEENKKIVNAIEDFVKELLNTFNGKLKRKYRKHFEKNYNTYKAKICTDFINYIFGDTGRIKANRISQYSKITLSNGYTETTIIPFRESASAHTVSNFLKGLLETEINNINLMNQTNKQETAKLREILNNNQFVFSSTDKNYSKETQNLVCYTAGTSTCSLAQTDGCNIVIFFKKSKDFSVTNASITESDFFFIENKHKLLSMYKTKEEEIKKFKRFFKSNDNAQVYGRACKYFFMYIKRVSDYNPNLIKQQISSTPGYMPLYQEEDYGDINSWMR